MCVGDKLDAGKCFGGRRFGAGEVFDTYVNINGEGIALKNFYSYEGIIHTIRSCYARFRI